LGAIEDDAPPQQPIRRRPRAAPGGDAEDFGDRNFLR
jgi:hypothetical protein